MPRQHRALPPGGCRAGSRPAAGCRRAISAARDSWAPQRTGGALGARRSGPGQVWRLPPAVAAAVDAAEEKRQGSVGLAQPGRAPVAGGVRCAVHSGSIWYRGARMPQTDIPAAAPGTSPAAPRHEKLNTKAASVVALAVLGSRVLGLVRDQVFGSLFGGGEIMDAFIMAFRIPNLLRDLFAEGALSTAFITVFSKTTAVEGDRAAWELANKVATAAAVLVSFLTLIGILCAPWIVAVLAHGFPPAKAALTVTLTRVMFPFILLVSLAALVMGMLNAKNVFGIPATASSFFNLGSIIAGVGVGWLIDPHFGVRATMGLAIGTLVGGAMQFGVQLPSL